MELLLEAPVFFLWGVMKSLVTVLLCGLLPDLVLSGVESCAWYPAAFPAPCLNSALPRVPMSDVILSCLLGVGELKRGERSVKVREPESRALAF